MKLFPIKKNLRSILWTIASVCIVFGFLNVFVSHAGVTHNVEGFAWNDLTGWISFNSTNCDPDGNGFSNSEIEGCPASHWDKVDERLDGSAGCARPDATYNMCYDGDHYVYNLTEELQGDIYNFEDPAVGGIITSVKLKARYRGIIDDPIVRLLNGNEYIDISTESETGCSIFGVWEPCGEFEIDFTINHPDGTFLPWSWDDIKYLQAGVSIKSQPGGGELAAGSAGVLEQIYLIVEHDGSPDPVILMPNGPGDYTNIDYQEPASGGSTPDALAYQVQVIEDSGSWSSPLWDSAKTTCSVEEGNRKEIIYGGTDLSLDGKKYYQRWRFWDSGDLEGLWSDGIDHWIMTNAEPTPSSYWAKAYGGGIDDEAESVQQTSDGGYIIAGHTRNYGAGSFDMFLVKTDDDGIEEWHKTYGGEWYEYGRSIVAVRR